MSPFQAPKRLERARETLTLAERDIIMFLSVVDTDDLGLPPEFAERVARLKLARAEVAAAERDIYIGVVESHETRRDLDALRDEHPALFARKPVRYQSSKYRATGRVAG